MIDLYYWPTPNGHKITLFLEETGLEYQIKPINIGKGDQFDPEFLKIGPNNRMPVIVDHAPADGGAPVSVFESGAILLYLAEKTGKFLPKDLRGRVAVTEWLFWQMGGLGPMMDSTRSGFHVGAAIFGHYLCRIVLCLVAHRVAQYTSRISIRPATAHFHRSAFCIRLVFWPVYLRIRFSTGSRFWSVFGKRTCMG
jgi:hypothetical protein